MLEKMGLLSESFPANVTLEGLLSRVGSEVNLYVGLVEEAPVANRAPMDGLLLPARV